MNVKSYTCVRECDVAYFVTREKFGLKMQIKIKKKRVMMNFDSICNDVLTKLLLQIW